ncbi:MAG: aminotransferase [Clostridia bacterium]|nr:aminotransferase [Clostridia bacterium]
MGDLKSLSKEELNKMHLELQERYDEYMNQKLGLDMSRGKPCPEQLDLSTGMLDILKADDLITKDSTDSRNYGGLDGIAEAKELFSQMLEVRTQEIIIGGNSSLNMMHDAIARAMILGVCAGETPWGKLPTVKFLCPSPGYDRHFAISELFSMEMIVVDMMPDGPDMDKIEKLVREDESIKGMWCVPKYSNPDGITYSDEVVDRLAKMNTKARDFRIFWDDAYTVHHLTDKPDQLKNILAACKAAGNPDRVFMFSSTSKITFAGAGIAMMAASEDNLNFIRKQLSFQTIGPDKINQLRHVRFFKNMENLKAHMEKHAAIMKPKFEMVLSILESEFSGKNIAWWHKPNGGYFISLNTLDGCAKAVVNMAGEAGVTLTKAGATYPHGKDPRDRNIRLAPTFPSLAELKSAIEIVCLCVKIVSIKKILAEKDENSLCGK